MVDGDGGEGAEVLAQLVAADEEPRGDIRDAQGRADVFRHISDDLGALPQSPFKRLFKKSPLKILKNFPPRAGFHNESRPWGKFLKVLRKLLLRSFLSRVRGNAPRSSLHSKPKQERFCMIQGRVCAFLQFTKGGFCGIMMKEKNPDRSVGYENGICALQR